MAIDPVTTNDTQAIDKVNAAIAKANLVDGLVAGKADKATMTTNVTYLSAAIATEARSRAAGDENEASARIQADKDEAEARADAINRANEDRVAGDAVRPTFSQAASLGDRPGELPQCFASSYDGAAEALSGIPATATAASGAVVKLTGAGIVAPRRAYRCEPGHQYRVRFVVQRSIDTDDPANDAVRLAIRWLDRNKAGLASAELSNVLDVVVASGRLEFSFNLAATDDTNIDAVSPASSVYFRPFVKTFGGGETLVEVIEVTDLSLSADWSPDVSALRREIAGLQQQVSVALDRIATLEAQ